jgi:hypothetical protein
VGVGTQDPGLQQSSATAEGSAGTNGSASTSGTERSSVPPADLPPGDWALFVVPRAQAAEVGRNYLGQLHQAGLDADQRTVDGGGQQLLELRVATNPVAVLRFVDVGAGTVVTVALAPT